MTRRFSFRYSLLAAFFLFPSAVCGQVGPLIANVGAWSLKPSGLSWGFLGRVFGWVVGFRAGGIRHGFTQPRRAGHLRPANR